MGDPEYRDHTDHLHIKAKRQTGPLMRVMSSFGHGLVAAFRPGDPDGTKARMAGTRGRSAAPLSVGRRAGNYLASGRALTPKQRRRLIHKAGRNDRLDVVQALLKGDAA